MREDLQKYFQFSPFFVDSKSMSNLDWEKFQDKIDKIPPSLYDLLVDDKTSRFVEALTQKYIQLNTQGPEIARIIRDVILADIYIGDMPAQFSSKLGVDQNTALEIARIISFSRRLLMTLKNCNFKNLGSCPVQAYNNRLQVPGYGFQGKAGKRRNVYQEKICRKQEVI